MRSVARLVCILAVAAVLTVGVGAQASDLKVVASFSILADVVRNVAGDTASVTSLIPVGADPHSFEPSARDIAMLADADIIFVAGANFEESLLNAIASAGSNAAIVEASACVPMRVYGEHEREHEDADNHDHDAHEGEAHDHDSAFGLDLDVLCAGYEALLTEWDANNGGSPTRVAAMESRAPLFEADCDGAHGACDPHVWSDPRSISLWTLYVRDILIAADPANRDVYADNADAYLKALDAKVRLELEPLIAAIPAENRVLLTNHETLGYFASAYGFEIAGFVLPGGSSMAEPSAKDLAALIDGVRAAGVTAVFAESTQASRVAEQVAAEGGAAFYTLYTDSLSDADGGAATYLDYITYNFTTIAQALTPR